MLDIKSFQRALAQVAEERGISAERVIETIEAAIATAYKKDYGEKGQKIKAKFNAATGDVQFVAMARGDFAASWQDPSGAIMGRSFDSFAYDGKGWYGPTTTLTGDVTGVTAGNELIAANGSGQQLSLIRI